MRQNGLPTWLDLERAAAEGIGRTRLYGRTFERVTSGAYVTAGAGLQDRCRAALAVSGPDALISHWTAAALWQLPLPPGRAAVPLHVTSPDRPHRATRRLALIGHTCQTSVPATRLGDVRVTGLVRTWCDLARCGAEVTELVVVGDALLRKWPGLAGALTAAVGAGNGHRGVRTARRARALLDPRAESPPESLLRMLVVRSGITAPVPQLVVRDELGRVVARVDLGWPDLKLALEYDGSHHLERHQWVRDLARRERLESLGWRVVVVTAEDLLGSPTQTATRIAAAVAERRAA